MTTIQVIEHHQLSNGDTVRVTKRGGGPMKKIIEEQTGLNCWKVKIETHDDQVRLTILGPKNGEKAFVEVPLKDLKNAVGEL